MLWNAPLPCNAAERNAAVPASDRIEVRIGINLGEVIVEGDDRYGEGVNIAPRLEQVAEPGTVYVSEKVAREVERKLAFGGWVHSTSRISASLSLSIGSSLTASRNLALSRPAGWRGTDGSGRRRPRHWRL
jgi:hypothetical protein